MGPVRCQTNPLAKKKKEEYLKVYTGIDCILGVRRSMHLDSTICIKSAAFEKITCCKKHLQENPGQSRPLMAG